jgi:hypothetical protein
VHYLYSRDCLGELRDDEWLYYLNDAIGYVRQGVDDRLYTESCVKLPGRRVCTAFYTRIAIPPTTRSRW